ncbi:MAG: InlB B-repeat-containing protein, partial [Acholeplasmatales bacterium]|nr:InlB B-repeat-containing protein [Acholeplasmatales bacterium]
MKKIIIIIPLLLILLLFGCKKESHNYYDVTFYIDGVVYSSQKVKENDTITFPAPPTFVSLYVFSGWSLNISSYEPISEDYIVTSSLNLYANYHEIASVKYTANFYVNGVLWDTNLVPQNTLLTLKNPKPMEGYRFLGWSVNENVYTPFIEDRLITSDLDLYAFFRELDPAVYNVSFYVFDELLEKTAYYNNTTILLFLAPDIDGYAFLGWSFSKTEFIEVPYDYLVTTNLDIYGFYEVIPPITYTVKFYVNASLWYSITGIEGEIIEFPTAPVHTNYVFALWSTKVDQAIYYENIGLYDDVNLYSIYKKLTFDNTDFTNINYNLKASFDEGILTVTSNLTITFTTTVIIEDVYFHLYANSYIEGGSAMIYGQIARFGGINILNVNDTINDLSFNYDLDKQQTLVVNLLTPLFPNEQITLSIDYILLVPASTNRLGTDGPVTSITQWHPLLAKYINNKWNHGQYSTNGESDYIESASFDLEVTHPKAYTVLSGGVDETAEFDTYSVTTSHLDNGRIMAFFASKNFILKTYTTSSNGKIRVAAISQNISYYNQMFEAVSDAIDFYSDILGPFIYNNEFDIIETNVEGFAMEYSGIVQMGPGFNTSWGGYDTIIHELGHQWFYSIIGTNSKENPF